IRAEYGQALERLVGVIERHADTRWPDEQLGAATAGLAGRFGLTERQSGVLARAAEALAAGRGEIRHPGALGAGGREARAVGSEAGLLQAALDRISAGFDRDEVRIGLVTDGRLVFRPELGGEPAVGGGLGGAAEQALAGGQPAQTGDGQWVLP